MANFVTEDFEFVRTFIGVHVYNWEVRRVKFNELIIDSKGSAKICSIILIYDITDNTDCVCSVLIICALDPILVNEASIRLTGEGEVTPVMHFIYHARICITVLKCLGAIVCYNSLIRALYNFKIHGFSAHNRRVRQDIEVVRNGRNYVGSRI